MLPPKFLFEQTSRRPHKVLRRYDDVMQEVKRRQTTQPLLQWLLDQCPAFARVPFRGPLCLLVYWAKNRKVVFSKSYNWLCQCFLLRTGPFSGGRISLSSQSSWQWCGAVWCTGYFKLCSIAAEARRLVVLANLVPYVGEWSCQHHAIEAQKRLLQYVLDMRIQISYSRLTVHRASVEWKR